MKITASKDNDEYVTNAVIDECEETIQKLNKLIGIYLFDVIQEGFLSEDELKTFDECIDILEDVISYVKDPGKWILNKYGKR